MEGVGDDDEVSIISDTTRNSDIKLSPFRCENLHLNRLSRSKEEEEMEQKDMNLSPVYPEVPTKRLKINTEIQNKDMNVSEDVIDDSGSVVSVSLLHSTYHQHSQVADRDASSNSEKLFNISNSDINQTCDPAHEDGKSSISHNSILSSNLPDDELLTTSSNCQLPAEEKCKKEEELLRQIQIKQDKLFKKTNVSSEEDFLKLKHQLQLLQPLLKHLYEQQRSERIFLAVDIKTSKKTKSERFSQKQRLEQLGKKQKMLTGLIKRQNELKDILKAAFHVIQNGDIIEDELVPQSTTLSNKTLSTEIHKSDGHDVQVSSKHSDEKIGKGYDGTTDNDNEVTHKNPANSHVEVPVEQQLMCMKTDADDNILLKPMMQYEEKGSNKLECIEKTSKILKTNLTHIQKPGKTNDVNLSKRRTSLNPCIISEESELLELKESPVIKLLPSQSNVRCASVLPKTPTSHGTIFPHAKIFKSPPPSDTERETDNVSPGTTTCSDVFPVKSKEICRRFQQRKLLTTSQLSSQSQSILQPDFSHGHQFGHQEHLDFSGKANIVCEPQFLGAKPQKFGGLKFPPLSMLINMNILRPGDGVLRINLKNKTFIGSLSQDGMIIAIGGEIFRTPLQWCRAAIQNVQMKKSEAYKMIIYKKKSLIQHIDDEVGPVFYENCKNERLLDLSSKETLRQQSQDVVPLNPLMHKCTVRIMSESDYASSEDLPLNFWSQNFASVTLGHYLIQQINSWN